MLEAYPDEVLASLGSYEAAAAASAAVGRSARRGSMGSGIAGTTPITPSPLHTAAATAAAATTSAPSGVGGVVAEGAAFARQPSLMVRRTGVAGGVSSVAATAPSSVGAATPAASVSASLLGPCGASTSASAAPLSSPPPNLFDIAHKPYRQLLYSSSIALFDFWHYLFVRQCQCLQQLQRRDKTSDVTIARLAVRFIKVRNRCSPPCRTPTGRRDTRCSPRVVAMLAAQLATAMATANIALGRLDVTTARSWLFCACMDLTEYLARKKSGAGGISAGALGATTTSAALHCSGPGTTAHHLAVVHVAPPLWAWELALVALWLAPALIAQRPPSPRLPGLRRRHCRCTPTLAAHRCCRCRLDRRRQLLLLRRLRPLEALQQSHCRAALRRLRALATCLVAHRRRSRVPALQRLRLLARPRPSVQRLALTPTPTTAPCLTRRWGWRRQHAMPPRQLLRTARPVAPSCRRC